MLSYSGRAYLTAYDSIYSEKYYNVYKTKIEKKIPYLKWSYHFDPYCIDGVIKEG